MDDTLLSQLDRCVFMECVRAAQPDPASHRTSWYETPTAPPPRVTYDVDLIAVVATLRNYHAIEEQFAERGFTRDVSADAPICRWRIGAIEVDLMPTDETVLGFSNRWYAEAAATAMRLTLPSGTAINLISAPAFLATKFEAFRTRGKADLLLSHDFEDIINVVEGRLSIVEEVGAGGTALRTYLARQFASIITAPDYTNVLPGLVAFVDLHSQRIERVRPDTLDGLKENVIVGRLIRAGTGGMLRRIRKIAAKRDELIAMEKAKANSLAGPDAQSGGPNARRRRRPAADEAA